MRISLFLMTKKGFEVLKGVISKDLKSVVDVVVIGVDKAVENDYSQEIVNLCKLEEINYKMSNAGFDIKSEYCLAISWRWLIKTKVSKLIVLHDSLLPKYRGFAPLVNALINGEKNVGVTALFANREYDKGDIIVQKSIEVNYPIKIRDVIDQISEYYIEIAVKLIQDIKNNNPLKTYVQKESEATYSLWRDEKDYFIDWTLDSDKIKRFVDAVGFPYLGAKSYFNETLITIKEAVVIEDVKIENRDIGKMIFEIDGKPVIVCGKGLIKIEEAIFSEDKSSIFPLKKFRNRFR